MAHATGFYTCCRLWIVKLRQERVEKRVGKFTRCTIRERVRVLQIAATIKISIPGEFISTDRGNRLFYIFIFDDATCDKQDAIKEYFAMGRHADGRLLLSLSDLRKNIEHLIRDNANLLILFK